MARRGIGVMVATVMLLVAACLGAGPAGAVLAAPAARGPGHPVLFARVWPYYPVASIVSTKSGEVLVKEPGGAWEPVRLFTPLPDGTQVQTSEGSRALLLTPTYPAWTYALLDADSRVELVRPSARTAARADLRLHQGRVWFYTRARYYAGEATLSAGGLGVAVQGPVDVVAEMKPSWAEARVLSGEVVADDGSLLQAGQGLRRSPDGGQTRETFDAAGELAAWGQVLQELNSRPAYDFDWWLLAFAYSPLVLVPALVIWLRRRRPAQG